MSKAPRLARDFQLCTGRSKLDEIRKSGKFVRSCSLFNVYWGRNNCRTGGVSKQKSKGRWQLASSCPVMLEMSDTQKNTMMIVPLARQPPGDSSAQPVNTEVHVHHMQSAVFGVLRAKENSVNNKINIVVDLPPETPDLSCEQLI